MKTLRPLLLCVGAGLLAACSVPAGSSEEETSFEQLEFAEDLEPGHKGQGRELHGMLPPFNVERFSFSGAIQYGQPLVNLRLEQGGLVAERQLLVTGTTPSLTACASVDTGSARSCGFVSKGAYSCEPGTEVTLGGGGCSTGSCTGDPVIRVCSGTQPCEFGTQEVLVSGDDACDSLCPHVSFTCPGTGIYNVMAGPYNTSQAWSLNLVPSSGTLGWQTLRGAGLKDALIKGFIGNVSGTIRLAEIQNAASETVSEHPYRFDPSGSTWLYQLEYRSPSGGGMPVNLCANSHNGSLFAVPVSGLYDSDGKRTESTTDFTFSCESGVISKCYRWGYQPWKDGESSSDYRMRKGHWSCTRMARADYCGIGEPHTLNGTMILPYDALNPQVIPEPTSKSDAGMEFEAAWSTKGADCVTHWRWQSLDAGSCTQLTPPIPGPDGGIINRCTVYSEGYQPDGGRCASLCDTPMEAVIVFHSRMFNESRLNGVDGGVPDAGQ